MTTFADQPLEEQIAQWREYLRRRQVLHGPDVEELEGHLRDQLVALTEAGLIDTLKGSAPFTVFAPTDAAFAKIPADQLNALIPLTYHPVPDIA